MNAPVPDPVSAAARRWYPLTLRDSIESSGDLDIRFDLDQDGFRDLTEELKGESNVLPRGTMRFGIGVKGWLLDSSFVLNWNDPPPHEPPPWIQEQRRGLVFHEPPPWRKP